MPKDPSSENYVIGVLGAGAMGRGKGKKGGDQGKGTLGKRKFQPSKLQAWESAWIDKIAKSQWGHQGRCRFSNSKTGCARGDDCRFKNECFLCGANHAMVDHHNDWAIEPWA